MKLDYQDIGAFVEHLREEALAWGKQIQTIDDLLDFIDENPTDSINIINRN